MLTHDIQRLQQGCHHDPFAILGRHPNPKGVVIRAFMPSAERVNLLGFGAMRRIEGSDLFEAQLTRKQAEGVPFHHTLEWQEKGDGSHHQIVSPYTFAPQIGDMDLYLFGEGKHRKLWEMLGSHLATLDGVEGVRFAVWAPNVDRVSVVGDFNGWNGLRHPMRNRGQSGVWEIFIPALQAGDAYKYEIRSKTGALLVKTDPFARRLGFRPETTTLITPTSGYGWQDEGWLKARRDWPWQHSPISIYEVHLGSWKRHPNGHFYSYRELAAELIPYVVNLGYTHLELLPIMEHPLDESWGYQVSGYYAATSRFGTPDDLRYFIDCCHQQGLGVLLDWVPAHFPRDDWALARFTGYPTYEYGDPKKGEHQDWGTLIFDYGRHEVRNFLIANALYWIEQFHIDGLRVDAVASMLYLDYSRNEGQWSPNRFGGREHLEAIEFLREMNELIHDRHPGVVTIAEESTAWPMVSRPTYMGGLGFSIKWNMGWMHDTLSYFQEDPIYRKYHHDRLTFSQLYAWSENFVLPFSHDEVVHLKRSMLDKMPGDLWQRFANLRLLYSYQYMHPGKKLLFMGSEFGQWSEWNAKGQLQWDLCHYPTHTGLQQLIRDLNRIYREEVAMHHFDFDFQGFEWIDCHDSEQSVISFFRTAANQKLVCVANFTPVPRERYRIGVPYPGRYKEIFNSDSAHYGGSNLGNQGEIEATPTPWMGLPNSVELTIPPLAGLILRSCNPPSS